MGSRCDSSGGAWYHGGGGWLGAEEADVVMLEKARGEGAESAAAVRVGYVTVFFFWSNCERMKVKGSRLVGLAQSRKCGVCPGW